MMGTGSRIPPKFFFVELSHGRFLENPEKKAYIHGLASLSLDIVIFSSTVRPVANLVVQNICSGTMDRV